MTALLGLAVLGFVCYLAVRGMSAAVEVLVTGAALVGMIAGGNWLTGRLGLPAHGARTAPTGPDRRPPIGAYCPGSELVDRAAHRSAGAAGEAEKTPGEAEAAGIPSGGARPPSAAGQ